MWYKICWVGSFAILCRAFRLFPGDLALKSSSEESSDDASLEEVAGSEESGESVYEIEGMEQQQEPDGAA